MKESQFLELKIDIMTLRHDFEVDRIARTNVYEAAEMAQKFYVEEMVLRSKLAAARNKEEMIDQKYDSLKK